MITAQQLIESANLTAIEAQSILDSGVENASNALQVYKQYLANGKQVNSAYLFMKAVIANRLKKKSQQAGDFNVSADNRNDSSSKHMYQGPPQREISLFAWREGLTDPKDIEEEDNRFEQWLRSKDGVEYIKRYSLREIPEHFQEFARDVLRFDHQTRLKAKHAELAEQGVTVIGPVVDVRPIRERSKIVYSNTKHMTDEELQKWMNTTIEHAPCIVKSKRITIDYLPKQLQEFAHEACNRFIEAYGSEENLMALACAQCKG